MVKIKGSITVSDKKMWDKFKNVIMRPMTDEDRYTKLELIIKKKLAALKKKKKNTKKKGGKKSGYNIKMTRKFRRTRRKRGGGGGETDKEFKERMDKMCGNIRLNIQKAKDDGKTKEEREKEFAGDLYWCNTNYFDTPLEMFGGKKSRRKRRRKSKKRKSRRRKKRSRRRRRKKR